MTQPTLLSELKQSSEHNVFVMMRYRASDHFRQIETVIRETLSKYGLTARLAKDAALSDDLWGNIEIYMRYCRFGIAVFEEIDEREFNPNISLELGYMYALTRRCLLLKDRHMPRLPTDICGRIYRSFDTHLLAESLAEKIQNGARKIWVCRSGQRPRRLESSARLSSMAIPRIPILGSGACMTPPVSSTNIFKW